MQVIPAFGREVLFSGLMSPASWYAAAATPFLHMFSDSVSR